MSFPYNDPLWTEAGDFLVAHAASDDRVLGPDLFWWLRTPLHRWVTANLVPPSAFEWVVVHKGEMAQFPRTFLDAVTEALRPVFANEVFVIWSSHRLPAVGEDSTHLLAFRDILARLPREPAESNAYEHNAAIGAKPRIERLAEMTDAELRASQNAHFRAGGYLFPTLRDVALRQDIEHVITQATKRWHGGRVLDIACGNVEFVDLPSDTLLVRTDLAEEALHGFKTSDPDTRVRFVTMDAHELAIRDGSIDGVTIMEALEHFRDGTRVMREVARVLRPGGELLVGYPNRNSLHLIMTRKLGWPEFPTNHQHIREYTGPEVADMLDSVGLDVIETGGMMLFPYWGIPGIDGVVRHLTDDDPEVVDVMRTLGIRAGAEFAYISTALARKREPLTQ